MALFELRTYTIKSGCREQWVKLMETVVIPFQISKGMTVVASFVSLENADQYVWIRRFDNEEQRQKCYDDVYGSDTWIKDIKPAMGDMLIRETINIHLLEPTPISPLQ